MSSTAELISDYIGSPKSLPKAVGYVRYIQQGSFKLLIEFDRICRNTGLQYFLCFGSLLGAVRTGSFIPWDDDIDVAMPRADYERLIELFNRNCAIPGVKAVRYTHDNGIWNLIKIVHEDIPSIYVDIFVVDACFKSMSFEEHLEFDKRLKSTLLEHIKEQSEWPSIDAYHQSISKLRLEKLDNLAPVPGVKPVIFFGMEFLIMDLKFSSFDYDVIFPLSRIKFEGRHFPTVHDPDLFLTYLYGDYERLPNSFKMHTEYNKLSLQEMLRLKKFLRS